MPSVERGARLLRAMRSTTCSKPQGRIWGLDMKRQDWILTSRLLGASSRLRRAERAWSCRRNSLAVRYSWTATVPCTKSDGRPRRRDSVAPLPSMLWL